MKIAFIDVDNTLLKGQIQQGFLVFLRQRSLIRLDRYIMLNLWFVFYKIGFISRPDKIVKFALKSLKGISVAKAESMATTYLDHYVSNNAYPKSFDFIKGLKNDGFHVILLSAAIDLLISGLHKYFDVDGTICTKLEVFHGVYTGKIKGPLVYGESKLNATRLFIEENNLRGSYTLACADHKSDLPLLQSVNCAYIANPDCKMKKIAISNNIGIIDLRS